MTLYLGVDFHTRQQTVSYLKTEDGTIGQPELHHERDDKRASQLLHSGGGDSGLRVHELV
jgi:hypothetical protein